MREVHCSTHYELHPESELDMECLRNRYPHAFPAEFVCVAKPVDTPWNMGPTSKFLLSILKGEQECPSDKLITEIPLHWGL